MELVEALRQRKMVRSFDERSVDPDLLQRILEEALRSPSAGHTRGTAWLVLRGAETARYWEHATTADWRATSPRWPGLSRAPVVVLSLASPALYVARYGEADKTGAGLGPPGTEGGGGGEEAWPVPYWFGDAAFATMALLLQVTAAGLGAALLGNFRGEAALLTALGVPAGWRLFATALLGYPDGQDHPSPSLGRPGPKRTERVHYGRW